MDKPKKILVVDDDKHTTHLLHVMSFHMNTYDYQFYSVADGEQGAKAVVSYQPDLVMAELKIPKEDGLYVVTKAKECRKDLPVILMTENTRDPRVQKAIELGAYFLCKPFSMGALKSAIEAAFNPSENLEGNL